MTDRNVLMRNSSWSFGWRLSYCRSSWLRVVVAAITCLGVACGGAEEEATDGGEGFASTSEALSGSPGVHGSGSAGYLYSTGAALPGTGMSGTSSPLPASQPSTSSNNGAGSPQSPTGSQASPDPIPAMGSAGAVTAPGSSHH